MATLTKGTTFTSGDVVTPAKLNNLVDQATLSPIVTADIADSQITTAKIADANVTTAKIADANVTTAKIADANVTTAKIADGAVTLTKIASGAIPTAIPAGAIMPFAMSAAPSGWLAADGTEYSKTGIYAALFAAIGTAHGETNGSGGAGTSHFRVPDLRGIFIRGASSQTISGITYSGTFGVKQADAFQGHWHAGADGGGYGATANSAATTVTTGGGNNSRVNGWQPINGTDSLGNSYGSVRTSTETRPANIALLYCIKF